MNTRRRTYGNSRNGGNWINSLPLR